MKNRRHMHVAWPVCLALLLLAGCSTRATMMSSFQDITSESQVLGCPVAKDRQYSALSVPGLIAASAPGFLYSFNPRRGPTTAIGISGDGTTYVVTKTIPALANNATIVSEIKECLEDIKFFTAQEVRALMSQAREKLEERMAVTNKTLLDSLTEFAKTTANASKDASGVTAEEVVEEALQSSEDSQAEQAQEAVAATNSTQELADIRTKLAAKEKTLAKLLSKPGILIFRWTSTDAQSGSTMVSKIAGHTQDSSKTIEGYAVVNGLRIASLYVGADIKGMWPMAHDLGFFRDWTQVTTMVAQAKEIAYISELSYEYLTQIQADLNMERLGKIAADWKNLLQISLAASLARVGMMSNTGYIAGSTIERYTLADLKTWEYAPAAPSAKAKAKPGGWFLEGQAPENKPKTDELLKQMQELLEGDKGKRRAVPYPYDGWTTFYQVNTSLDTLKKMIEDQPQAK